MPPPPPLVSGVSPREGPPGTLITIRGENLGVDSLDLESVMICGYEMVLTAEWISTSKLTARSGCGVGLGEIIVKTRSGGTGTSSVKFIGQQLTQVLPKQECAVFVDETHTFLTAWDKHRPVVEEIASENLLGLADDDVPKKFSTAHLHEMFPNKSGTTTAVNFSPFWYLLENHTDTSFNDLKNGLEFLNTRKQTSSKEPMSFVKTNLSTFMECQDALVTMHNKLTWDENQKALQLDKLNMLLQAADRDADSLYLDIIRRKEKADSTRNVLSVMRRFQFLFYLPADMRKKVAKGEYDAVINDYTRAKLLFKDTNIDAFKKIFNEVENEMQKFRLSLHSKLMEMPSTLEDKKKIIRHLVDLDYSGNAAWECLNAQYNWLREVLLQCKDEYTAREHDEYAQGTSQSRLKLRADRPLIIFHNEFVDKSSGMLYHDNLPLKMKSPQRVLFAEELTRCLTEHFLTFYRLGHAYFEGQLPRKEREETHKTKIELQNQQTLFRQMMNKVLLLFCNLVRKAFLPETLGNLPQVEGKALGEWTLDKSELSSAWLPQCVRTVRHCAETIRNDLPFDSECSTLLEELVFDLRSDTMRTILKQAIDDVHKLHTKELWVIDTNDSAGSKTQLPVLFENCVLDAVNNLNNVVIRVKAGEQDIFKDHSTQEQATKLCIEIVKAFTVTLEKCAFESTPSANHVSPEADGLQNSQDDNSITAEKKLIITLSNCHYTLIKIMPRLIEELDKHGYQETQKVLVETEPKFQELYQKLFEKYIDLKANPIVSILEEKMCLGNFDWSTSKEPLAVRVYIRDCVSQIVEVHAEVYSILPADIVPKVMYKIIEDVAQELNRLIFSIAKFNKNGALQARIDILAFKKAVDGCLTRAAVEFLDDALDRIPVSKDPSSKDEQKAETVLGHFIKMFRFHTLVFSQYHLNE